MIHNIITYGSGGGLTPEIVVSAPNGSTVTVNGRTPTKTIVGATNTDYIFSNLPLATYTITASLGQESSTKSVIVSQIKQYYVEIRYLPTASLTAKSGVTYSTDISSWTAEDMKLYSNAISNNPDITNDTSDVYLDFKNHHYHLFIGSGSWSRKQGCIPDGEFTTNEYFKIIGFNHDTLTDSDYYGDPTATGKAGITWQLEGSFNSLLEMNLTSTNVGGWSQSRMRTLLNNLLYGGTDVAQYPELIGFEYKDAVAHVNKLTSEGNRSSVINTDSDGFFLLSRWETTDFIEGEVRDEGDEYKWYKLNAPPVMNYAWWLRSPHRGSTNSFLAYTKTQYQVSNYTASSILCASIAFCS